MLRLPAEWEPHEATFIALPFENTDWNPYLDEILLSYDNFIRSIAYFEPVYALCPNKKYAEKHFGKIPNVTWIEAIYNDTWIRDFGPIDVEKNKNIYAYDFTFNAWGEKFVSNKDNAVTASLYENKVLKGDYKKIDFVLEGGSIESNGRGSLLTTTTCLLNQNRNPSLSKLQIEENLSNFFGLGEIFWLNYGYLEGDDTDAHIDTLARFISPKTIAYVTCKDSKDSHFEPLRKMEDGLKSMPFSLIALPLPDAIYFEGRRLPATYANFVFVNGGLVVPTYNQKSDDIAIKILQNALPHLKVIGVDATVFIRQHGSLHCACMHRISR